MIVTLKLLQILGFLAGGFVVSYVCNLLLLRFSESLGIRNKNDVTIRWSNQSKPSLGGVSFFVVFVFCSVAYSVLFRNDVIFHNIRFVGLFAAGSIAFLMGLADDAYNTRPWLKLTVQILCGFILVWTDSAIALTSIYWINAALTVVWVVLIMNSLNMLDNMDGITGTVVFFILLTGLISNWMTSDFNSSIWSITIAALLGGLVGFLRFNVNPSRLFMGDAGSQFIGLVVAFFAVDDLWMIGPNTATPSWTGIIITLIAFTPAAADTLTVVINRLRKGQSPMIGGKDHTTHHLVYAGLTDRKVWLVFLGIGALSAVLCLIMINLVTLKVVVPVGISIVYFVAVFILLYRNTLKFPAKK